MKRSVGALVVVLTLILSSLVISPDASGTDTIYIDNEVAASASGVVNGSVVALTYVEIDGTPHTVHEIDVDSVVSGTLPDTIYVEIPGGRRTDGAVVLVSNSAEFMPVGSYVQLGLQPAGDIVAATVAVSTGESTPVFSIISGERGVASLAPSGFVVERASSDYSFNGFARPGFLPPADYLVNPDNSGLSAAATIAAVRAGFDRWEDDIPSAVDFTYAGTTGASGLQFQNGHTNVSWEYPNSVNSLGSSLAVAHMAIINGVYEFEVVMSRNYQWFIGASPGRFDIETVIAHEVGHGIGLSHVPNAQSEVMYPSIPDATIKGLGSGDLNGARILYPNTNSIAEPGHSVDTNADGDLVTVSLKTSGVLWARRDLGSGWSSWEDLGAGNWASSDVTIAPDGTVQVAAVKKDGRLFTHKWTAGGSWTGWVNHGGGWDTTTTPSISSNGSNVVLAAITADGNLQTKVYDTSWSGATTHGLSGWAHVDVDIAADGDLWFIGVKTDGRLYLRKHLGSSWSGFGSMGVATWSADTPPAVAARSNGVVFGAVKANGRLYTREQVNGSWSNFARQGVDSWTSVDVALTEEGLMWLAATKDWGRLYTRNRAASGTWGPWQTQGADTWSTFADSSIAIGANDQPAFVHVKADHRLYLRRSDAGSWGGWSALGAGSWAPGQ